MRLTAARLRPERPFVVATRTATVMDEDGDPVDLIAGISGVTVGHDLTVRYPHLFAARSLQPPPAPSKVAPPKPARTDGTPAWLLDTATVDHRDTPVIRLEPDRPATHTVTIAPDALRDLHDHAEYSTAARRPVVACSSAAAARPASSRSRPSAERSARAAPPTASTSPTATSTGGRTLAATTSRGRAAAVIGIPIRPRPAPARVAPTSTRRPARSPRLAVRTSA